MKLVGLVYNVEEQMAKGFTTFVAYAGVDASQGGKGDVKFNISKDGNYLLETSSKYS